MGLVVTWNQVNELTLTGAELGKQADKWRLLGGEEPLRCPQVEVSIDLIGYLNLLSKNWPQVTRGDAGN